MQERGYDLTMQIFMGDTGETAGMVMVSWGHLIVPKSVV